MALMLGGLTPSAIAAEPSVEQYGGGSAGVSSDVAAGADTSDGIESCIAQIVARHAGKPAEEVAERIVSRCMSSAVASPNDEKGSGLPVTGLDIAFIGLGIVILVLAGWLISRLVAGEPRAAHQGR